MNDFIVSIVQQLLTAAIASIPMTLIIFVVWIRFFQKKERRLFKNIQRPIMVISTENKLMEHEFQLLKNVGLFKINYSGDCRGVDLLNGYRLVIVGYSPNSLKFKDIFNAAKSRQIPIIVYATPGEITIDDMKLLSSYSHYCMCNSPLRLESDVFGLMSTYPEESK